MSLFFFCPESEERNAQLVFHPLAGNCSSVVADRCGGSLPIRFREDRWWRLKHRTSICDPKTQSTDAWLTSFRPKAPPRDGGLQTTVPRNCCSIVAVLRLQFAVAAM